MSADDKLSALERGDVDGVLVGGKYSNVTSGDWIYSKTQCCVRIHNGPVICDPLTEGNNYSAQQCADNGKCLSDAKSNAAKVAALLEVLGEVGVALSVCVEAYGSQAAKDALALIARAQKLGV